MSLRADRDQARCGRRFGQLHDERLPEVTPLAVSFLFNKPKQNSESSQSPRGCQWSILSTVKTLKKLTNETTSLSKLSSLEPWNKTIETHALSISRLKNATNTFTKRRHTQQDQYQPPYPTKPSTSTYAYRSHHFSQITAPHRTTYWQRAHLGILRLFAAQYLRPGGQIRGSVGGWWRWRWFWGVSFLYLFFWVEVVFDLAFGVSFLFDYCWRWFWASCSSFRVAV